MEWIIQEDSEDDKVPDLVFTSPDECGGWEILRDVDEEMDNIRQSQSDAQTHDDIPENNPTILKSGHSAESKMASDEAPVPDSPADQAAEKEAPELDSASGTPDSNAKNLPNAKLELPTLLEFSQPATEESIPVTSSNKGPEVTNEGIPAMSQTSLTLLTFLMTFLASISSVLQQVYEGMRDLCQPGFEIPFSILPGKDSPKVKSRKSKRKRKSPKGSEWIRLDDNSTSQTIPSNSLITSCHKNYGIVNIGSGSTIEEISENYGAISIGKDSRLPRIISNYGMIFTGDNCIMDSVSYNYGTITTGCENRMNVHWNTGCIQTGPGTVLTFENKNYGVISKVASDKTAFTCNLRKGEEKKNENARTMRMENGKLQVDTSDKTLVLFGTYIGLQPDVTYV